jgi:carbonic anhydrase/acetyltransferase-like protein (isoleucine patch superfamily)
VKDRYPFAAARLEIHPTAFVAPGAVVVGAVRLGARASVWFNTVLRGDTAAIEVGDDTNLQDNTTVHVDEGMPAVVGARVTVGHRAIVHGCVIGDDCLVGMGAVVLSGARIGAGSLIGASALVREGQVIPPGSVALGSPARVVGPTVEAHRAAIRRGAEHYAALSRGYLALGFGRPLPGTASAGGLTDRDPGPMTWLEWASTLAALGESTDVVSEALASRGAARFRTRSGSDGSALEIVCRLRDTERDVVLPRLERLLAEDAPELPDVDVGGWAESRGWAAEDPQRAVAEFRSVRGALVARLARLGRDDWSRAGTHSSRGPFSVADLARSLVEHDLGHRHRLERALEDA